MVSGAGIRADASRNRPDGNRTRELWLQKPASLASGDSGTVAIQTPLHGYGNLGSHEATTRRTSRGGSVESKRRFVQTTTLDFEWQSERGRHTPTEFVESLCRRHIALDIWGATGNANSSRILSLHLTSPSPHALLVRIGGRYVGQMREHCRSITPLKGSLSLQMRWLYL